MSPAAESTLHLKSGTTDGETTTKSPPAAPVFDLSKVDVLAVVDEAVLTRYSEQGFKFSAKVEMKRQKVPDARVSPGSDER